MNNFPVFIPNFPPPPLPPPFVSDSNNPIPVSLPLPPLPSAALPPLTPPSTDLYKDRLNSYLERRKRRLAENKPISQPQSHLKLSTVSHEMSKCIHLIQVLNENIKTLSQSAPELTKTQWDDCLSELNSELSDLSAICSKYDDTDVRTQVKSLIDKRQEKRNRIRKRKLETTAIKKYEAVKRAEKHKQIDEWVERNAMEIAKNRQQIETKQRAEQMFMDVKSRRNEADKFIQLMDSLKELNRIRNRDKYIGSGQSDIELNRELDEMKQMWIDAAKTYAKEEKRLRKFINFTDDWEEWRTVLFGESTYETNLGGSNKKNNGWNQLIEIRRLWDQFIVSEDNPFGSRVPMFWAIPNANPSEKWKIYLKDENS